MDTGDFGSEKANDANLASGNKSVGYGGSDGDPRTVTPNKGPVQLPKIGPLTAGFNAISKNIYNAKNLKEARKDDLLGGEMLTTGQKKTKQATVPGGNDTQLCPDGTYPPCKSPGQQIKAPAKKNMFLSGFQAFDDGGEVVISSNVDKDLL